MAYSPYADDTKIDIQNWRARRHRRAHIQSEREALRSGTAIRVDAPIDGEYKIKPETPAQEPQKSFAWFDRFAGRFTGPRPTL